MKDLVQSMSHKHFFIRQPEELRCKPRSGSACGIQSGGMRSAGVCEAECTGFLVPWYAFKRWHCGHDQVE